MDTALRQACLAGAVDLINKNLVLTKYPELEKFDKETKEQYGC